MSHSLVFDTLSYVKMLKEGGVEQAEVHSASLSKVLGQNVYTKSEVDYMIEQAFNRLEETFNRFDRKLEEFKRECAEGRAASDKKLAEYCAANAKEVAEYRAAKEAEVAEYRAAREKELAEYRGDSDKKFAEIELRLEKTINRYTITTVSVLGTLIVVMSAISTFAHYIFH